MAEYGEVNKTGNRQNIKRPLSDFIVTSPQCTQYIHLAATMD